MKPLEELRLKQLIEVYVEYIMNISKFFDVLSSTPNIRQDEEFQGAVAISSAYVIYI